MRLEPRETITDPRMLVRVGVVLLFVLVGFVTHAVTHLEPSLVALLGAGAAILVSRVPHPIYLEEIEWETLLFFAGLFIMVGSLVHQGVIGDLADSLTARIGDNYAARRGRDAGGLRRPVGNRRQHPLRRHHGAVGVRPGGSRHPAGPAQQSLWWTLALGADLGGNATAIGASANVVVTGIAKRNGHPITFWTFTRYGLVVTAVTIALCVPYIALRYFVLA